MGTAANANPQSKKVATSWTSPAVDDRGQYTDREQTKHDTQRPRTSPDKHIHSEQRRDDNEDATQATLRLAVTPVSIDKAGIEGLVLGKSPVSFHSGKTRQRLKVPAKGQACLTKQ